MGVHLRKCILALFALALMGARPALAQTGSITGRVTALETGAPLVGARVEAVDGAGQVGGNAFTGETGQFQIVNLQAGTYTLVVSLPGHETQRIEGIRVLAGQASIQAIGLVSIAFELNPLIVSASRRQEKVLDAPANVVVVDSRAVGERPATTPVDHLRSMTGVDIVTQGIQSTNVVLRGFNNIFSGALHTLTDNRIAGIPSLRVNAFHFIPSTDEDVERMEVVLGPGSALYGPNTTDGVLHIITKSPLDQQGTSVSVAGGEQSVLQAAFRSAYRLSDNFGLKVSGQYLSAEEWSYADPVEQAETQKFASSPFFKQDLMRATGIDAAEADRRIALIGKRDFDVRRWGGEVRADWRPTGELSTVLTAGTTLAAKGIELTGLGAAQAVDWRYSFVQARANWRRLFAQAYVNMSDAGDTYLLRNGAPISDGSRMYVAQLQHGLSLGERQNFTYGLDFIYTNPVTEGTINGKYEEDDHTTEYGAYLQSETALSPRLSLVLAGRVDEHSALPEAVFSPRAGVIFKPTETQAFRLTYNRAFSTPSSINQFLDLGSAIPDERAAQLGYSLRIQGTGTNGFGFAQNGGYFMRSPFTPAQLGGPAQLLPADAATFFVAAVNVLAAQGAIPDPNLLSYLRSLTPTASNISTNFAHPSTGETGPLSSLALPDVDPIRESTTTTFEAGYKGVLGDRLLFAADFWYSKRDNLVTPLTIATPFLLLNGPGTAAYLTQKFMTDLGMSQAQAQATATALATGLAQVPVGVVSSADVNANGAQLLVTYYNVADELDLYGTDLSATALLTDAFSLTGTLSLVNENKFETKLGETVTLNAPKTKGSLALGYRNTGRGINGEVRARFNDEFPVRSGVYNGTVCIGGGEPGAEECVKSFTLVDLTLGYQLPMLRGAAVQLGIQNLLDEDYRSYPGVPTIGRMALLRLKYDF